jgi:adenylate cyclase
MEATFCFVDLAGFSALTEAHGDDTAADLALRFTGLVTETLAGDGRLVKTIGDAVLVVSPSPLRGIQFISRLWRRATAEPDFPVLRAGLHHGVAVERGDDLFGSAVNLAARVAAEARGGQVLATAWVADAARGSGLSVTPLGTVTFRPLPARLRPGREGRGDRPGLPDANRARACTGPTAPGRDRLLVLLDAMPRAVHG